MPEAQQKEYESVLLSVKQALGLAADYTPFDPEIIMHINSIFNICHQLGVGPQDHPFSITGPDETWSDFTTEDMERLVRSYMYLKVKLMFDPPSASTMFESMSRQVSELEWRMNVLSESIRKDG